MNDPINFEELERRVNRGEMTFNEAMVYVAATTGHEEEHNVTSELHAALCAIGGHALIPRLNYAGVKVNDKVGLVGFVMHLDGPLSDTEHTIIEHATKAVLEAGSGGRHIEDFDLGELLSDGTIRLGNNLRHDDWEDAIRDFRDELDTTLDPPTNQQGQEGPDE